MSPELSVQAQGLVSPEPLAKSFVPVIPDASCLDWAAIISGWTMSAAAKGEMLPKSPEQILELFNKGHSLVMVDSDGNVVSHAAATFIYPDGSVELGAVYTDEAKRGRYIGKQTVRAALKHIGTLYPGSRIIFALANDASRPLFEGIGGIVMQTKELHADVWSACKDCPNRPSTGAKGEHVCCDTPYDLTKSAKGEGFPIFNASAHTNGKNGTNHATI